VSGSVLYDDASATVIFVPSANLQPNTTYTVKVSPEIKDLAGNTLGGTGAQWDFTTGATSDEDPPQIDSGTPPVPDQGDVNLKIDVPNNTVSITFDEAMNPETINNSTFTLETTQGPVEGTVGYVPSQYEAVFLPSRDLDYMTLHTATVSGAVEDVAGNQLGSSYSWSFYTVANDPGTSSVTANIVKVTDSGGKVSAYVLFTDQDGNAVTNLTKYHFNLREKVDPDSYSEISTSGIALGSSRESKSVLVLVDDTPSMNGQYIETLKMAISNSVFGSSLGQFDTAMIATFASPNPGSPRVMLYPPGVQAPGDGEFSSSQADLINYLNLITVFGAPYSAVHDAMGYGMEDMMGQAADDMRGINAVIAFTDASPAYYFDGAYNNSDVLNYASLNEILIYAIGEKYADPGTLPQYAALGYNTSGYYRYVSGPPEYQNAYDEVIDLIHSGLRYVYKITWFTGYSSGDLDIQIQANYSTQTGGDFNNTDTELNYTLP
jgi:hypothetical protein